MTMLIDTSELCKITRTNSEIELNFKKGGLVSLDFVSIAYPEIFRVAATAFRNLSIPNFCE